MTYDFDLVNLNGKKHLKYDSLKHYWKNTHKALRRNRHSSRRRLVKMVKLQIIKEKGLIRF